MRLCASLRLSLWASLASLGLAGPLWASPGLSGPLWASLHNKNNTLHNRQLEPQFSSGTEVARQKDHAICTRQLEPQCPSRPEIARQKDQTIPDSWSPSVPRGPKLLDNKTRQYIPGSWSPSVLRGSLGLSQPASQPPSQPAKRMTGLFYPRWASPGLSMYIHTYTHRPLWAPSQLMKSYRSSVQICDAAQKCRVSFPGSLIRAA